jgi:hypothetical protein
MRWAVSRLEEIPSVPGDEEDDPDWRPLQHFFGLTAFGANVFVAPRGDETLVEAHDERQSGQEELYLVLEGEAEFELDGETLAAGRGTALAVTDPAVTRRAVARLPGTALLAIGCRPGCFETTWRREHFANLPRAGS